MIRKKLVAILMLLFPFLLKAQHCQCIINIVTDDSASFIFVNDNFIGRGEVQMNVDKGIYPVAIRESLVKWNCYEVLDTIDVDSCNHNYKFEYSVAKKIFVDSRPQDAAIIQDDSILGYTPQFVEINPKEQVELKKGTALDMFNYKSLFINKYQKIDFKPLPEMPNFTESVLFKILLGSATVFGATAAYFKLKADKKYDEYVATQNRSTFDTVNRYDIYSGIALGLLQINVGYLIYRFLTD